MVPPWAPSELSAASFRAWNTDSYGPPEAGLTAPPLPPRWNGPTVDISLFRGTRIRPTVDISLFRVAAYDPTVDISLFRRRAAAAGRAQAWPTTRLITSPRLGPLLPNGTVRTRCAYT